MTTDTPRAATNNVPDPIPPRGAWDDVLDRIPATATATEAERAMLALEAMAIWATRAGSFIEMSVSRSDAMIYHGTRCTRKDTLTAAILAAHAALVAAGELPPLGEDAP